MAENNKENEVSEKNGGYNISDLPDGPLEYILSFLSTREIVKTCILSRSWRHLWKYVPDIRITGESTEVCCRILEHVLTSRGLAPISTCDIEFLDYYDHSECDVNKWIFYVLSVCKVQNLRVSVEFDDDFLHIADQTIISKHLRRLEFEAVILKTNTVDFSTCPALEELRMHFCNIEAKGITSKSLKHLSMSSMQFEVPENSEGSRIHISAPSLLSLELDEFQGWTPLFDSMPYLVDATIRFEHQCYDHCDYTRSWDCGNDDCFGCYTIDDNKYGCILLQHLSGASCLRLTNEPNRGIDGWYIFPNIFERDFTWCPLFRNLKKLVLNEWFVEDDLWGLVCLLQHSPALEKLTLILHTLPEQIVESGGSHNATEQPSEENYNETEVSLVRTHLKIVKVKCIKEEEWIKKIVMTLTTFIPREIIHIKEIPSLE